MSAACGALPPVIVVAGEEAYLRQEALDRLAAALDARHPGMDRLTMRGGPAASGPPPDWSALLAELSGRSLFATHKMVVLRDAHRLFFPGTEPAGEDSPDPAPPAADPAAEARAAPARSAQAADFAALLARWPEDTWLLAETPTLPQNRTLGKVLAANAHVVPCPVPADENGILESARRMARRLAGGHGRDLSPVAAHWLAQAHGANLGALASELEKLDLYLASTGDGDGPVSGEAVARLFAGTVEFHAFALTNAIEARDAAEALRIGALVTEQGARDRSGKRRDADASSRETLARLPATLLGLLAGAMAHATRGDAGEVAAWTGVSPWRAARLLQGGRRYGAPRLRRAVALLAETTRQANDTGGDARVALDRVLMALSRPE